MGEGSANLLGTDKWIDQHGPTNAMLQDVVENQTIKTSYVFLGHKKVKPRVWGIPNTVILRLLLCALHPQQEFHVAQVHRKSQPCAISQPSKQSLHILTIQKKWTSQLDNSTFKEKPIW